MFFISISIFLQIYLNLIIVFPLCVRCDESLNYFFFLRYFLPLGLGLVHPLNTVVKLLFTKHWWFILNQKVMIARESKSFQPALSPIDLEGSGPLVSTRTVLKIKFQRAAMEVSWTKKIDSSITKNQLLVNRFCNYMDESWTTSKSFITAKKSSLQNMMFGCMPLPMHRVVIKKTRYKLSDNHI